MKQNEIIWKEISLLNCSANAYPSGKPYKKKCYKVKFFLLPGHKLLLS